MNSRKNLFVKILKLSDRENLDFVSFASRKDFSTLTRELFAREAEKLRATKPEAWQEFRRVTRGEYVDTPAPDAG